MTKTLNEAQFRGLVRKLVHEYASDDQNQREPNFNKQSHADPSARNWDNGLDEEDDSSDLSQGGPDAGEETDHEEDTKGWSVNDGYASSKNTEIFLDADGMMVNTEGGYGYESYRTSEWIPLNVFIKLLKSAGYNVTRS